MIKLDLKKTIHTTTGTELLDIQLEIRKHGFITLFGKSGVGKTTLLRMIAGLETPEEGTLQVGDEVWFDSKTKINVKPQKRNAGFVFQDYALFPNMTVEEHLFYAQGKKDIEQAHELLDIFHLTGLYKRKPATLSGGQMQRLAVARALARKPALLVLDEPLSALDEETRITLQDEIILAHRKIGSTAILVSHDKAEVLKLSDMVYIIEHGTIKQSGVADTLLHGHGIESKIKFFAKVVSIDRGALYVLVNDEKIKLDISQGLSDIQVGQVVQLQFIDAKIEIL